ncbi:hypothetical protein E0K89_017805 [Aquicoccus sp. SCR17]|nr:hypothetical protein [Carideicomes alvinocaridis]
MEMLLLGEPVDAQRAYDAGLVNRLCDEGDALATALFMAERLGAMAPLVMQTVKRTVNDQILTPTPSEVMFRRQAEIDVMLKSHDYAEGISAFNEGRQPKFNGR